MYAGGAGGLRPTLIINLITAQPSQRRRGALAGTGLMNTQPRVSHQTRMSSHHLDSIILESKIVITVLQLCRRESGGEGPIMTGDLHLKQILNYYLNLCYLLRGT